MPTDDVGRHPYTVRVKVGGLVEELPKASAQTLEERCRTGRQFALMLDMPPMWEGFAPARHMYESWTGEWQVFVEAFNADLAREYAMRRIQEAPEYVSGVFERARTVTFEVDRLS